MWTIWIFYGDSFSFPYGWMQYTDWMCSVHLLHIYNSYFVKAKWWTSLIYSICIKNKLKCQQMAVDLIIQYSSPVPIWAMLFEHIATVCVCVCSKMNVCLCECWSNKLTANSWILLINLWIRVKDTLFMALANEYCLINVIISTKFK